MDNPKKGVDNPKKGVERPKKGVDTHAPKYLVFWLRPGRLNFHDRLDCRRFRSLDAMSSAANAFLARAKRIKTVQDLAKQASKESVESVEYVPGRDNHDADDFNREVLNKPRTPTYMP